MVKSNLLNRDPRLPDAEHNSEEYLEAQISLVDKALIRACEEEKVQALITYYKLTKRLIEKQEVTHKVDGSSIAKAFIEARRELATERMGEVSTEHNLLPQKVWENKG